MDNTKHLVATWGERAVQNVFFHKSTYSRRGEALGPLFIIIHQFFFSLLIELS